MSRLALSLSVAVSSILDAKGGAERSMSSGDDLAKIMALTAAAGGSTETAPVPPADIEEGEANQEAVRTQAMQVAILNRFRIEASCLKTACVHVSWHARRLGAVTRTSHRLVDACFLHMKPAIINLLADYSSTAIVDDAPFLHVQDFRLLLFPFSCLNNCARKDV